MFARILLLAATLLAAPALAFAQAPTCPQLFASGQPPALLNPKLGQRTTLLCNDAYALLASGVTRGAGLFNAAGSAVLSPLRHTCGVKQGG